MPPKGSHKKGATAPSQSMDDPPSKRARKQTARAAQEGAASFSDSENGSGDEKQDEVELE